MNYKSELGEFEGFHMGHAMPCSIEILNKKDAFLVKNEIQGRLLPVCYSMYNMLHMIIT